MKPGRELDYIIAEKVMGWTEFPSAPGRWVPPGLHPLQNALGHTVPNYSTDITAAWSVVEKLCPDDDEFRITRFHHQQWQCTFNYFNHGSGERGDTAPHAICLAALEAVERRGLEQ